MNLSLLRVTLVAAPLFKSCLQFTGHSFCIPHTSKARDSETDAVYSKAERMSWTWSIPRKTVKQVLNQEWFWTVEKLFIFSLPSNPVSPLMSFKGSHSLWNLPGVNLLLFTKGFPGGAVVKNPPAMQEAWFDPWVRKIPGEGHGNPLQYSLLENSMDRGAWWAILITKLIIHWSRGWSYTDQLIDHALITCLACTEHVADHTMITWLRMH